MTKVMTCNVRLLVRKVSEPNQVDHVVGHLDVGQAMYDFVLLFENGHMKETSSLAMIVLYY